MARIRSSETSANIMSTRCHSPEDSFLKSHGRQNFKSGLSFYPEDGATCFSETSANIKSTRRHNPEDCFPQNLHRYNLKLYHFFLP